MSSTPPVPPSAPSPSALSNALPEAPIPATRSTSVFCVRPIRGATQEEIDHLLKLSAEINRSGFHQVPMEEYERTRKAIQRAIKWREGEKP